MSLAGELRNKIYAASLASGTTVMLLISKKIYAEAKPILYKAGVLKLGKDGMYFGKILKDWPAYTEGISPVPSESELPLIRNVTIDIDRYLLWRTYLSDIPLFCDSWTPRGKPQPANLPERGIMAPFMNTASAAPRGGTCEIILRNFDKTDNGHFLIGPVLHALRYFNNFKHIILIITADYNQEEWLDLARNFCKQELQEDLGTATWHPEVETFDNIHHSNGYLMFSPREKAPTRQGNDYALEWSIASIPFQMSSPNSSMEILRFNFLA